MSKGTDTGADSTATGDSAKPLVIDWGNSIDKALTLLADVDYHIKKDDLEKYNEIARAYKQTNVHEIVKTMKAMPDIMRPEAAFQVLSNISEAIVAVSIGTLARDFKETMPFKPQPRQPQVSDKKTSGMDAQAGSPATAPTGQPNKKQVAPPAGRLPAKKNPVSAAAAVVFDLEPNDDDFAGGRFRQRDKQDKLPGPGRRQQQQHSSSSSDSSRERGDVDDDEGFFDDVLEEAMKCDNLDDALLVLEGNDINLRSREGRELVRVLEQSFPTNTAPAPAPRGGSKAVLGKSMLVDASLIMGSRPDTLETVIEKQDRMERSVTEKYTDATSTPRLSQLNNALLEL